MKRQVIKLIIFILIFELIFPKITLGLDPEDQYDPEVIFCNQAKQFADSQSSILKEEAKAPNGYPYYYQGSLYYNIPLVHISKITTSTIQEVAGIYGTSTKAIAEVRNYYFQPVYTEKVAFRPVYTFTEILESPDLNIGCDPQNKTLRIAYLWSRLLFPRLSYIEPDKVEFEISGDMKGETIKVRQDPTGKWFVDEHIVSDFSPYQKLSEIYPLSSRIVVPRDPKCQQWTNKGLFVNTVNIQCTTDAFALNGKVGFLTYKSSGTQKNFLGFLATVFFGLIFAYLAPAIVLSTMPLSLIFESMTIAYNLYVLGNAIALGGLLGFFLTQTFPALIAVIEGEVFGTIENPQGGLEQFQERIWVGGFSGVAQGYCSLVAQPSTGDVPLNVKFTLNWYNCDSLNSYEWDGPCSLTGSTTPSSCSYTFAEAGNYGPYRATINCSNETFYCYSSVIKAGISGYDLSVTSLDIRSFICKNKDLDQSFWNEFSSRNPGYLYAPSTTYATQFYNEVASSTCPESQRNRPVEFSATGTCLEGPCPPAKIRIYIRPTNISATPYETKVFESTYDKTYPKSIKGEYTFDNAYDYKVTACFVDQNNNPINDKNNFNNCKEWTLRIFDYFCYYGFAVQSQRDWTKQPPFKILNIYGTTDSPTRYWRNQVCRARFSF